MRVVVRVGAAVRRGRRCRRDAGECPRTGRGCLQYACRKGWVRVHCVGPSHRHSLALVLHAPVLEPNLQQGDGLQVCSSRMKICPRFEMLVKEFSFCLTHTHTHQFHGAPVYHVMLHVASAPKHHIVSNAYSQRTGVQISTLHEVSSTLLTP